MPKLPPEFAPIILAFAPLFRKASTWKRRLCCVFSLETSRPLCRRPPGLRLEIGHLSEQVLGNFCSSGRRRAKSIWSQRLFRGLCIQSRLISQVVEIQQRFFGGSRQARKYLFPQ